MVWKKIPFWGKLLLTFAVLSLIIVLTGYFSTEQGMRSVALGISFFLISILAVIFAVIWIVVVLVKRLKKRY